MEPKLLLCTFMLLIQISLAIWQRVTVEKGQTLTLSCPIINAHENHADWKNSEGFLMFFNNRRVLMDKRYSIIKLSQSEFTISVSNINFKDGGIYTCSEYNHSIKERKVKVTVVGLPRISTTTHNGKTVIKCTAEGNDRPEISWQMDDGPENFAHSQQYIKGKKYVSVSQLVLGPAEKRVTVKCLVRHPALHSQHLMDFVKIGQITAKIFQTPTINSSPTAQPLWSTHDRTTVYYTTTDVDMPSTDSSAKLSPAAPTEAKMFNSTVNHVPSINSHFSTSGWASVSESTQETTHENSTGGNLTVIINDPRIQTRGNSSLLVFLVTCLIICLLVVVIFFAIKLRRAHIIWKRENEESDPSEESSKSKSSQEDKNAQAQRRKGLFNTTFTQYVIEEPTTVTSVVNTGVMAATAIINNGHTSQAQPLSQAADKAEIKETEL